MTRTRERARFAEKLTEEIRSYGSTPWSREPVRTLYIGGGTPSLLEPALLGGIMEALRETFELRLEEVTLEMNPDDVNGEYLEALRGLGVTRASMGIQTFDPGLLDFMNRAHSREEGLRALEALSASGFEAFTVDLIYGNPGEESGTLEKDLEILLEYRPPHLSAYSLTIEPGTRLGKQVQLGRLLPPEDDRVADHYDLVVRRLGEAGLRQYEVSNFSRPGREAVHNSSYWEHANYLGMGPGAHSFWWDAGGARRWERARDLEAYLAADYGASGPVREELEELSGEQLAEERIMMGLRTRAGVGREELSGRYGYELSPRQAEYLADRKEKGLVESLTPSVRLSSEGLRIADSIILDLITAH